MNFLSGLALRFSKNAARKTDSCLRCALFLWAVIALLTAKTSSTSRKKKRKRKILTTVLAILLVAAIVLIAIAVLALLLSSCELIGTTTPEISVSEDGYLVVDGDKTEYKSGKEDTVTVDSDDYIVVNGNKTEYNEKFCIYTKM